MDDSTDSDWSQLTALWSTEPDADILSYNIPSSDLSMNIDFHSFGIEPHFDPTKYHIPFGDLQYPYFSPSPDDFLSNQFPFSFQAALDIPPDSSSSSTPSRSSSPHNRPLTHLSIPSTPATPQPSPQASSTASISPQVSQTINDSAEELAQRVRLSAGVMLAVPMTAHLAGRASTGLATPATPVQTKLPIPRLPRQNPRNLKPSSPTSSSYAGSSSAASTPPPSTPPLPSSMPPASLMDQIIPSAPANSAVQVQVTPPQAESMATVGANQGSSRPKTSHTTIERRYRTNLNARIQSLRMSVPALRVLEDRDSADGKKIKRALKGGITVQGVPGATGILTPAEDGTVIDVIDERGYVDGVKVARKCSKANVLGKAVEYIKVLKRREHRLRAEQGGLKTLISGLVGGPALLREWEKEWRDRFGGEEKDELGADEMASNEVEDEDSDEDEEDDDGETGRKRKRGRVASNVGAAKKDKKSQSTAGDNAAPDAPAKRKRGRPRKVPIPSPSITASNPGPPLSPAEQDVNMLVTPLQQQHQNTGAPQQYLLATFALFSFFNSPLTSHSRQRDHHQHRAGVVLNHPPLAYAPEIVAGLAGAAEHHVSHLGGARTWAFGEYVQAFQLAVSVLVLFSMIMSWLNVGGKSRSWLSSASRIRSKVMDLKLSGSGGHKNHDWLKIGGQIILKDSPSESKVVSLYTCARVYHAVLAGKPATTLGELCTLSLVMHKAGPSVVNNLLRARSRVVWDQAKTLCASLLCKPGKHVSVYERLVLESMDADEAANRISDVTVAQLGLDMSQSPSPLRILGGSAVRERMVKHLAFAFVRIVGQEEDDKVAPALAGEEEDREKTFLAAAELGGRLAELGRIAERLCRLIAEDSGRLITVSSDLVRSLASSDEDDDVRSLILALVLYQRVFYSHRKGQWTMLSPPPSPGRPTVGDPVFFLKKTLGSRVFEEGCVDGLEDARDGAVDLIVEIERKRRH
ncbi:hypothetical protein APHAL10511_002490 [Amanita phalloides]|nr:hypothetical protein APHAL10511_002490 [Amanita phalloides]